MLAVVAVPVYIIYRALDDEKLLDRFMSTYEETANQQSGCVLRHVQERGGPDNWGISSGFAFQGADRWFVSVVLTHEPSSEEILSYCESLKLIADRMLDRSGNSKVHTGPMPRAETNRSGHNGDLSPAEKEPEQ